MLTDPVGDQALIFFRHQSGRVRLPSRDTTSRRLDKSMDWIYGFLHGARRPEATIHTRHAGNWNLAA